ncbi:aminopeptidase [Candidatus Woesearchaeota archaeon]|nr:aminopeptidase [Candidatus Woesearchaeota archaeon]
MNSIKKGAEQAVNVCMKVRKGEKVVIITDKQTLAVGRAFEKASRKKTDKIELFVLEDYGKRPLKELPDEIRKSLKDTDVSFLAVDKKPGSNEGNTIRVPVRKIVTSHGGRHAGMPGITKQMLEQGLSADYHVIKKISGNVYNKVKNAKEIIVKNKQGTDLKAKFSKKLKWIKCDGHITSGNWSNLPDGEVFTSPARVDGKAVVVLLGDVYRKLLKKPITFHIKNSRVVDIDCSDKNLKKNLWKFLKKYKNGRRVGEFAIGTNIQLKGFVGRMLQDEKHPGVHIAFGCPYPEKTGAKWDSKSHMDVVMVKTDIFVDGKQIMRKGKFVI